MHCDKARLINMSSQRAGRTSPLVLTSISLVMDALLNDVLMRGIIRIQHLDRLPPTLTLGRIGALNRKARKQGSQRAALCIHTGLDELLGAAKVGVAVDHCPGTGHGGDPEAEEQRVAVLGGPFFGALEGSFVLLQQSCAVSLALDFGFLLGVVLNVVLSGGAVGSDDSYCELVLSSLLEFRQG